MDDSCFARAWVIATICFSVIVISGFASCTINEINDNEAVRAMVNGGAHPVDARCAVKSANRDMLCAVRAAK